MITKLLELRDRNTFIPLLCVELTIHDYHERYLVRRAGYGISLPEKPIIMITNLIGGTKANNDPYEWGDRTYKVAHGYIEKHWGELKNGDVVDVEFILGETTVQKVSEQYD